MPCGLVTDAPLAAIVLAAGLGTRMHSETPKHLHPLLGRRLADWVVEAARELDPDPLVVVLAAVVVVLLAAVALAALLLDRR